MRQVVRVPLAMDREEAASPPSSTRSSPMEDLVFALEQEPDAQQAHALPWEQTAPAAASTIQELQMMLGAKSEAENMVSCRGQQAARPMHAAHGQRVVEPSPAKSHTRSQRPARPLYPHSPYPLPLLQLARHVELAAGGWHRVDPAALAAVLQRLGYSAKLQEATASLHKFKQGVRHQFVSVCLPGAKRAGCACCGWQPPCVPLALPLPQERNTARRSITTPPDPSPLLRSPSPLHDCADTGRTGLSSYIVEPNFRDCFCVAHPTPRYAAVLDALPQAVVADKVRHRTAP